MTDLIKTILLYHICFLTKPFHESNIESSNLMLKGVFWMWIIISGIMALSAFGVWKKQQDSVKIGEEEES